MISFENVTKTYKNSDRPALKDVSLEIDKGDFVFLVGASGSGKSTLLRLVLKEERVTSGAVHVLGYNLRSISSRRIPFYRRNLGVVFQDFRLLPNKSASENIAFALEVTGKSAGYIQEAVPDVLRLVGLDGRGDALPHELSGGEQQRVAIARAVVTKPAILLADEPTGNLDPDTSAGIMSLLERINASGTTILMATHDTTIVNRMRKRVIGLELGRLVRDERDAVYREVPSAPDARAERRARRAALHDGEPAPALPARTATTTVETVSAETPPPRIAAVPATPKPAAQPQTEPAAGPAVARPQAQPSEAPDIQVIAHESQPLTERLGLIGGAARPATPPAPDSSASEERK